MKVDPNRRSDLSYDVTWVEWYYRVCTKLYVDRIRTDKMIPKSKLKQEDILIDWNLS